MSKYIATWSGRFPNLCSGEWELYKNGERLDIDIPFQGEPAYTHGIYQSWHFKGWDEVFEDYADGMYADEWIDEYKDWLASFAPKDDWQDIYAAFQVNDWRHTSCGGCI